MKINGLLKHVIIKERDHQSCVHYRKLCDFNEGILILIYNDLTDKKFNKYNLVLIKLTSYLPITANPTMRSNIVTFSVIFFKIPLLRHLLIVGHKIKLAILKNQKRILHVKYIYKAIQTRLQIKHFNLVLQ
jgi:hypothetical protein